LKHYKDNFLLLIMFTFLFFITAQIVSQVCLGCICEVSSGCNTTIGCSETVCGPFAITWGYWSDAGKPTLNSEPLSDNAYAKCVNDPYCAAAAVQNYMTKFGHDCTGNGVIDCEDYLRIHRLGANGCTGALNSKYENRFKLCLRTFQNQHIFKMFPRVSWIAVTIIVLFCVYSYAQLVSLVCLGCLCEVSTGCNISIGCNNMVCGPFSITKYYWEDVGKPPPMGELSSDDDGLLFLQKLCIYLF
ncbi:LYS2 protein, partial [Acromyrmex insinuator]